MRPERVDEEAEVEAAVQRRPGFLHGCHGPNRRSTEQDAQLTPGVVPKRSDDPGQLGIGGHPLLELVEDQQDGFGACFAGERHQELVP